VHKGTIRLTYLVGVAVAVFASVSVGVAVGSPLLRFERHSFTGKPPTTAQCEAMYGIACYDPHQFQTAYNMKPLYKKGDNGKGETIVIVDSYGSPTIKKDLKAFDKAFKLPAPPSFKIIQPAGKGPKWNPKDSVMPDWGIETSLDVEYSHAIAPGANILLAETPVAETEGVHGFPQIVKAENYVINHHLGQVISQSFGATEQTFPSHKSIMKLRSAYKNAAKHNVTVLAGSGDEGPTNDLKNEDCCYTHRVDSWPSSDPLVTSLGGIQLFLTQSGKTISPPQAWNDTALLGQPAASGGGDSSVFDRPSYQKSVKSIVGKWRGDPDMSMSAAVNGGALVYMTFKGLSDFGLTPGYTPIGGTSDATPEFAGVVAIADQIAGHGLGQINPTLYKLGDGKKSGITDVTLGNTTVTFTLDGKQYTVNGYTAVKGYDMATGLGYADGAVLCYQLAHKKK
jgi:subtilase family serine protease